MRFQPHCTRLCLERFSVEFCKLSLWPITKNTDDRVNQSKLETNTCSWRDAREKESKEVAIGFGLTSHWLRKWREVFKPVIGLEMQNEHKRIALNETRSKRFRQSLVTSLVLL